MSQQTTQPEPATDARATPGSRIRDRALVVLAATVAALVVWAIIAAAGDLVVDQQGTREDVTAVMVLVATLLGALAGWALLAVLERITGRRARRIWTVVAGVVLVLSLVAPADAGADTYAKVVLVLLHLVVGAVAIPGFRRSARA